MTSRLGAAVLTVALTALPLACGGSAVDDESLPGPGELTEELRLGVAEGYRPS